jgi:hypothetical protein
MCIKAIAKCLQGDFAGAVDAEKKAWGFGDFAARANLLGFGDAGANSSACVSKKSACVSKNAGGNIYMRASHSESHRSHACASASASRCGSRENGYGQRGASFEKTTTQTCVGADGSVTQKTTRVSSGAANAGYGYSGYNNGSGYGYSSYNNGSGYGRFGESYGAQGYGNHQSASMRWNPEQASGAFASSGSFAMASVSIQPTGLLAKLLNLFGGMNQQAA